MSLINLIPFFKKQDEKLVIPTYPKGTKFKYWEFDAEILYHAGNGNYCILVDNRFVHTTDYIKLKFSPFDKTIYDKKLVAYRLNCAKDKLTKAKDEYNKALKEYNKLI